MRRWIPGVVCVVLALSCVASIGLWAFSWRTAYCLSLKRDTPEVRSAPCYAGFVSSAPGVDVFSMRGGLEVRFYGERRGNAWRPEGTTWAFTTSEVTSPKRITEMRDPRSAFNKLGFTAGRWSVSWAVGVPYWFVALVSGLPPIVYARRAMRRRRLAMAGCCRRCGYDLRASSGRCPECGQSMPVTTVEAATSGEAARDVPAFA